MKNNLVPVVITALIFGAGGFFGGMKYQESKQPNVQFGATKGVNGQGDVRTFVQGRNGNGNGNGAQGMQPVAGEIIAADDTSITVKLADGSSKIVLLSNSTTINKSSEASKTDLKIGEKVSAFGTTNSDGSVTAQNVQLGNMLFRGRPESSTGTSQP